MQTRKFALTQIKFVKEKYLWGINYCHGASEKLESLGATSDSNLFTPINGKMIYGRANREKHVHSQQKVGATLPRFRDKHK